MKTDKRTIIRKFKDEIKEAERYLKYDQEGIFYERENKAFCAAMRKAIEIVKNSCLHIFRGNSEHCIKCGISKYESIS